jgi:predicted NAD-dependent protein-ADP-ribosyltransferase YbiA (DUF1768 family)
MSSDFDVPLGIGLDSVDDRSVNPAKWKGLNLLGFVLMEVRAKMREL